MFVTPTFESNPKLSRSSDFLSASGANVRIAAPLRRLLPILHRVVSAAGATWNPHDGKPRPHKHFSEHIAHRPEVVVDMPVTMAPSSGAIADALLHDHNSFCHRYPARVDSSYGLDGAFFLSSLNLCVTTSASSILVCLTCIQPPVTGALVVPPPPPRSLVSQSSGSHHSPRQRDFGPSTGSDFSFVSGYLSRFRDWMDG